MKKLNKNIIVYTFMIIFVVGIYYLFIRDKDYIESNSNVNILEINKENTEIEDNLSNTKENIEEKIVIYITGAVKNEGIYDMKKNSRIADSIEKAGGLTEEANIENINLAYILEDGMKIHIPKKNENINEIEDHTNAYLSKENTISESSKNINNDEKININTATQTELETLPGIGPSTALRIIEYRKENGKFNSIEDIKKISGIGDRKFSQIKDLIKI